MVGVENAGGYGRLVCAVLAAAGYEVVNVPAGRVKRERVHEGPGKSDPGDAVAIAQCVLRHRDTLDPGAQAAADPRDRAPKDAPPPVGDAPH